MSSVHEQTGAPADKDTGKPSAPTPRTGTGMNRSQRGKMESYRKEFLDLVAAIVQSSAVLLDDARDQEQARFAKDLEAIHSFGLKLQKMGQEFFTLDAGEDLALQQLEKSLRHDMLNALNVIINYCEEWIEDSEEEFLQGFLPDLKQLHGHGKACLAVLNRIRGLSLGEAEEVAAAEQHAELAADPLFSLDVSPSASARTAEPGYCLVVDDSEQNRDILTRLLLRQGHRVETAVNGRDAVQKIEAGTFDIVFLDIMMPEMNGFQVLQHLKADERYSGLPVLMISALDEIDIVARCIAMGAEDYLPKPFNPILLKARIGACLAKKRFRDRETLYLRQIEQAKQRSDQLLHVILPNQIVEELKSTNEVKPRRYENVAVLFADLVGFTSYCDSHSAEEVVLPLQKLVEAWENCALRYGVEKIKTIGDAFMAASGLLCTQENPVLNCVRCGLEMIAETQKLPEVKWNLRVGIDVGQVVAGVIGQRQYLFDLWGDTVNTSARMESNGLPGRITLTVRAWERISHMARGERGEVEPKGKGKMTVYRLSELLS